MTYKDDALVALYEGDGDELTASDIKTQMPAPPSDLSPALKRCFDDGYVTRDGDGKKGDPYRYELTAKGKAKAKTLADETAVKSGLQELFGPDGDGADTDADTDDASSDSIEDVKRTTDALAERLSSIEDVVGTGTVEREDVRHRLRTIEDTFDGADTVVTFDDDDFVELVLMVAQSECGGYNKKKRMLRTVLGVDTEAKPDTADDPETVSHADTTDTSDTADTP